MAFVIEYASFHFNVTSMKTYLRFICDVIYISRNKHNMLLQASNVVTVDTLKKEPTPPLVENHGHVGMVRLKAKKYIIWGVTAVSISCSPVCVLLFFLGGEPTTNFESSLPPIPPPTYFVENLPPFFRTNCSHPAT